MSAARLELLSAAGFNVLNLDPADIDVDLFTDVPDRSHVTSVAEAGAAASVSGAREPPLDELAAAIYGPAHYVFATKGRAAEVALVKALELAGRRVLAPPLFLTTEAALRGAAAIVEPLRLLPPACDVDLAWLSARLAGGGVDLVYLEPNNNGLGGAPLSLENLAAVSALCRQRGVRVVLDATRLLSNAHLLGENVLDAARRFTALADAFTVGLSKELPVPYGALLGVRDPELHRRVHATCFLTGTLLEPLDARVRLGAALAHRALHPGDIAERARQLGLLCDHLVAGGVACRLPPAGHAVFVVLPADVASDARSARSMESLLYQIAGVRTVLLPYPHLPGRAVRLALTVGRYSDQDLIGAARGIAEFVRRTGEAPALIEAPGATAPMPYFARYALA